MVKKYKNINIDITAWTVVKWVLIILGANEVVKYIGSIVW